MHAASSVSDEPRERVGGCTDAPMLLRALGAVNFNHPRAGRRGLFEWMVTRIGRGAKKGMATVSRGLESRVPGGRGEGVDDARTARYILDGKRG